MLWKAIEKGQLSVFEIVVGIATIVSAFFTVLTFVHVVKHDEKQNSNRPSPKE